MSIFNLGKGSAIKRLANTIAGGSPDTLEKSVNSSEPGTAVPASSPDYVNPGTETLVYRQYNGSSSITFPASVVGAYPSIANYNPVHDRSINGYPINDGISVGMVVVAGGAGSSGQKRTGGGGAGGVHVIPHSSKDMSLTIDTTYPIGVGGGGGGSSFNGYSSTRGGTGGQGDSAPNKDGNPGGCGGGCGNNDGSRGGPGAGSLSVNNKGVPSDPSKQGYDGGIPGWGGSNGGGQGGSAAQNGVWSSSSNPGITVYGIPVANGGAGSPPGPGGNSLPSVRGSGRQGAGDQTGASGGGQGGTVIIAFLRANS